MSVKKANIKTKINNVIETIYPKTSIDCVDGLESKAAVAGGTDLSLCTTGEKYLYDKHTVQMAIAPNESRTLPNLRLAIAIFKRNDGVADNLKVCVISNMSDGLSYKDIVSSENVNIGIARDPNNANKIIITNNSTSYCFAIIVSYLL